jgi:hypothetical protein
MNRPLAHCYLLFCAATPALVLGQEFDAAQIEALTHFEKSMPEPTVFAAAAAHPAAAMRVVGSPSRIESDDSIAEIAAVELVGSRGEEQHGVRVTLERRSVRDRIYLGAADARQLRDELTSLNGATALCDAKSCVHGIARCRPSQAEPQAYCPSVYKTRDGESGVGLSTPRSSFRFPSVQATAFADAIETTIAQLTNLEAGEE